MGYELQDFSRILGMEGISDATLQSHFKLYQGYVKNTNALMDKTTQLLDEGKDRTPEFAELRRRLGFEFSGMRLHEYYFGNLKGQGSLETNSQLSQQITQNFGSFEQWKKDFTATGAMRGVGWSMLCYDLCQNQLLNCWITLHQDGLLPGLQPLLVLDVWEHAYYLDYQTERPGYLEAFMKNVNWQEVNKRFETQAQGQQRRKAA